MQVAPDDDGRSDQELLLRGGGRPPEQGTFAGVWVCEHQGRGSTWDCVPDSVSIKRGVGGGRLSTQGHSFVVLAFFKHLATGAFQVLNTSSQVPFVSADGVHA